MENTSGQGVAAVVPPELDRWNWGAFLLNWIWGIGNNTFIALLMFVPVVNIVALVGDDEVESLDGHGGVVFDGVGGLIEVGESSGGGFFVARVVVGVALQDGIEALDGGDGDAADGIDGV